MTYTESDLGQAKAAIGLWIEELALAGTALPNAVKQDLLDELAIAEPVVDPNGRMCLELPALSSLGVGIFQRSFLIHGKVVRVGAYFQSLMSTRGAYGR